MSKINALFARLRPGQPVTSEDLADLGVSADLAVHYARAGWLRRLGRGVYVRPDTPLDLHASLRFLERRVRGLHVGGTSALDWHGIRHHVAARDDLHLYGWDAAVLPTWFAQVFPSHYQRRRLFDEKPEKARRVSPFGRQSGGPLVSDPERAVLEMLSDVGVRQPLDDARALLEATTSLRASVLQDLLMHCQQIKAVRLCLTLGRELRLPWASKLELAELPTGSAARWVGRTKEGLLVLSR